MTRCFCSAPLHEDDGIIVCSRGHIRAFASAVPELLDRLSEQPDSDSATRPGEKEASKEERR
jgi:hypothetical protein